MAVEQADQPIEDQTTQLELPVSQGTMDNILTMVESVAGRPDADGWIVGDVVGVGGTYEISRLPEAARKADSSAFATILHTDSEGKYDVVQASDGEVTIIDNATQKPLNEDDAASLLSGLAAPDLEAAA